MKLFFFKAFSFVLVFALLYSCSSKRDFSVSKRRYNKGYYVSAKRSPHLRRESVGKEKAMIDLSAAALTEENSKKEITVPFQPYSSRMGNESPEVKRRIAENSTTASVKKGAQAKRMLKIKYAASYLKKSRRASVTGDDGTDLLLGIVLMILGTAILIGAYYLYLTPSAPGGLVLALALIIIGSVIASIGSYMVRQSLGINNSSC
ncbi:MAG: hypothetical protein ACJ76F_00725, partial [Bacteroidia bacterium]